MSPMGQLVLHRPRRGVGAPSKKTLSWPPLVAFQCPAIHPLTHAANWKPSHIGLILWHSSAQTLFSRTWGGNWITFTSSVASLCLDCSKEIRAEVVSLAFAALPQPRSPPWSCRLVNAAMSLLLSSPPSPPAIQTGNTDPSALQGQSQGGVISCSCGVTWLQTCRAWLAWVGRAKLWLATVCYLGIM